MPKHLAFMVVGILSALFVPLARAQTTFEDDGTVQIFLGTRVHVCSSGAMFGVDAQNNRFMCLNTPNLGRPVVDAGTQGSFFYNGQQHSVHVCPAASVMVGWHEGKNWLICAPTDTFTVSPHSDTGTQATEPNHPDRSVHVCDQSDAHSVMVGMHVGDNVLICASDAIVPPPFNLQIERRDGAGFPLNARWQANRFQSLAVVPLLRGALIPKARVPPDPKRCEVLGRGFRDPLCTTEPIEFNVKSSPGFGGPSEAFCWPRYLGGHVNWKTSSAFTYTGTLDWEGFSGSRPVQGDADYNFSLTPDGGAGLDTGNTSGAIGIEFASYETIDHFRMPWWARLHKAVDADNSHAHHMVEGLPAIVTGTLGLDCEYASCSVELHPAFMMAVEVDGSLSNNKWAFFARNNGNEGSCSSFLETVSTSEFVFDIPWKPNAAAVPNADQSVSFEQFSNARTAQVFVTPLPCEQKVRVRITGIPDVASNQWIGDGEVNLNWTPGTPPICRTPGGGD